MRGRGFVPVCRIPHFWRKTIIACRLFPRLRGFLGKVIHSPPALFRFHFLAQDQSTVVQRAKTTVAERSLTRYGTIQKNTTACVWKSMYSLEITPARCYVRNISFMREDHAWDNSTRCYAEFPVIRWLVTCARCIIERLNKVLFFGL